MKPRWMLAALAMTLACSMMVPVTASARQHKADTAIRRLSSRVIHGVGGSATLTGKLVYRKKVRRHRRKVFIDAPLSGRVTLVRSDTPYGPTRVVRAGWTNGSTFSFKVTRGGYYAVRYSGNKKHYASEGWAPVYEDVLSIKDLRCVSASRDASGGLFITVAADFEAPNGILTSATPGAAIFATFDGSDSPLASALLNGVGYAMAATPDDTTDPLLGFDNAFIRVLRRTGTCEYGFNLPGDQVDDVFCVGAIFASGRGYVTPISAVATFTPSALLP